MVTKKQISALKYMIFISKNGNELSKRVLAFLIDQSEGLTREVCLTLVADREGYTADEIREVAHGVHAMQSANCTTHLHALLSAMGSELTFSVHYGDFDPTRSGDPFNSDGQFFGAGRAVSRPGLAREDMPLRYTFWLSKEHYSRRAALVVATHSYLEQIVLRSGLYSTSKSA